MNKIANEQIRRNRNEYQRQYKANHKDKVKQWNLNYYLRQAEKFKNSNKVK